MKIAVHVDSAANMLYFNRWLKKEQWEVMGFFYDPNIHPFNEYNRCQLMQKLTSVLEDIIMMYPEYNFEEYLTGSTACATQKERCAYCYRFQLEHIAHAAQQLNIPYFTTSLLLHPKHDQELLKKIGDELAEKYQIKFLHHSFKDQWAEASELADKMNVYRQPYCGCIYSERYRFYPTTLDAWNKEDSGDSGAKSEKKTAASGSSKK